MLMFCWFLPFHWQSLSTLKTRPQQQPLQCRIIPNGLIATVNEFVHLLLDDEFALVQLLEFFEALPTGWTVVSVLHNAVGHVLELPPQRLVQCYVLAVQGGLVREMLAQAGNFPFESDNFEIGVLSNVEDGLVALQQAVAQTGIFLLELL